MVKAELKLWRRFSANMIRNIFLIILAACFMVGNIACDVTEMSSDEQRVVTLNKALMCPVCPGESIDQSQNQLAVFMRELVSNKVEDGLTDEEIKQYFVDRYGPSVLLEPPAEGFSMIVWVVPPLVVIIVVVALYIVLKMMSKNSKSSMMISKLSRPRREHLDFIEEELKKR